MPDRIAGCSAAKVLLTGVPCCGKTTLLETVLAKLPGPAGGFITREVRSNGIRVGFEMITLQGVHRLLAHLDFTGQPRVGRFGVDLDPISSLAVPAIQQAMDQQALVVVDEIGPMEMYSVAFRQIVWEVLNRNLSLLGTIVQRSLPETDRIKQLPGTRLVEVRKNNRNRLAEDVLHWVLGSYQD